MRSADLVARARSAAEKELPKLLVVVAAPGATAPLVTVGGAAAALEGVAALEAAVAAMLGRGASGSCSWVESSKVTGSTVGNVLCASPLGGCGAVSTPKCGSGHSQLGI